ncbi:MAG: hypothetical protein ABSC11_07535 [Smithella sp.]
MAKLKTREIIILVVAGLFVLYAVYAYLIPHRAGKQQVKTSPDSVKIEGFISETTNDVSKNKLSDFDKYVVKRAGIDSGNNPFLKKDLYMAWTEKESGGSAAKIIYSGYVESAKNKMAVINGFEYRTGEQLAEEGYILKQITPSTVLIFDKRTGSMLKIPIQE